MISTSKPSLGISEYQNVLSVLTSGMLASGRWVNALERHFSKRHNIRSVVAVSNGTTALHLALLAVGVGSGDEVITTPFTFIATTNAILMTGATPVFVDIDPMTYCIDPHKVSDAVTPHTKAILAVNLYGLPAEYATLRAIAREHNLLIIEDAAQSIGAQYQGEWSGALGDIATFSLYATKNITSGEGGLVTTQNDAYGRKIRMLRHHGMSMDKQYAYEMLGYNYRMTDLQASIACAQLDSLDAITRKRRAIAHEYTSSIREMQGIVVPIDTDEKVRHVYHQYTIRVLPSAKRSRDEVKHELLRRGIRSAVYYPQPLYEVDHVRHASRFIPCPETENACKQVLSLPIYPSLAPDDQWYIIETINQLLR